METSLPQEASVSTNLPERTWSLPAWAMSFLMHATLFTVGALTLRVIPRGVEEPGRGAGIVLMAASASGRTEYLSEGPTDNPANRGGQASSNSGAMENTPQSQVEIALPGAAQQPQGAGPALPKSLDTSGLPGDDAGIPGAGSLVGTGNSGTAMSNGTGEATLEVFGVKGTGSRFVYVFDRSASMAGFGGRPLAAAKRELTTSLQSLGKVHQFQIIFYNEEPHIFNPRPGQAPQLCFADEQHKEKATAFVTGITGDGGTQHLDALLRALAMVPDVIFFLTDADDPKLTETELQRIRDKNRRGSVINCVEFGAGPSTGEANFLKRLAAQNHGQHTYVDVTRLKAP